MCMGFGCNAAGVIGARIIDSPRERLIAILTNNFVPCNGRYPSLLHFPCSTTLMTIKKETNSWKWTLLASALPTVCVIVICMITTGVYNLIV